MASSGPAADTLDAVVPNGGRAIDAAARVVGAVVAAAAVVGVAFGIDLAAVVEVGIAIAGRRRAACDDASATLTTRAGHPIRALGGGAIISAVPAGGGGREQGRFTAIAECTIAIIVTALAAGDSAGAGRAGDGRDVVGAYGIRAVVSASSAMAHGTLRVGFASVGAAAVAGCIIRFARRNAGSATADVSARSRRGHARVATCAAMGFVVLGVRFTSVAQGPQLSIAVAVSPRGRAGVELTFTPRTNSGAIFVLIVTGEPTVPLGRGSCRTPTAMVGVIVDVRFAAVGEGAVAVGPAALAAGYGAVSTIAAGLGDMVGAHRVGAVFTASGIGVVG